jgi:hypothetical protein
MTLTAKPQSSENELSPEQRKVLDARLADARMGPTYGPFTASQASQFLKGEWKSRAKKTHKKRLKVS